MGAALLALVAAQGATAYRAAALAPAGAPRPPAARSAAPRLRAARVGARPPRPPPLSMHGAHHGEGAHAHGDEGVELSRGVLAQSLRHLLTHRWWAASARAPASGGGALALDATAGGLGWRGALARWRAYLPHDEDRITLVGAAINIFLSALKLAAGVLGHSAAMVADAAHSLSDLASDVITMWSVRMGRLPPDDDHPYGHGRFEALGSLLIAAMLVGTGWAIGAHAWQHGAALLAGQAALAAAAAGGGHVHGVVAIAPRPIALVAALLSLFSKEWLYRATAAVGRRLGSTVVVANAQHHRSDALSSVVAFFGIGGAMLGLPLLDPLAGLVVSAMVAHTGLEVAADSLLQLTDTVDERMVAAIDALAREVDGVVGLSGTRVRWSGQRLFVDLCVQTEAMISTSAANDVCERVKLAVLTRVPAVREILVHSSPHGPPLTASAPAAAAAAGAELQAMATSATEPAPPAAPAAAAAAALPAALAAPACPLGVASRRPRAEVEADVVRCVSAACPLVLRIEHITVHYLHFQAAVEVAIQVDDSLTVRQARRIAEGARCAIIDGVPDVLMADIHLDLLDESPKSMQASLESQWEGDDGAAARTADAQMLTGPLRPQTRSERGRAERD